MPGLREQLAAIGRRFYERGWMLGTAGNLSARCADGTMWITASGVPKGELQKDHFIRVRLDDGEVAIASPGRRASAETSLHRAIYAWDGLQQSVLHVHTVSSNVATRIWEGPDLVLPPIEMLKGLDIWEEYPRVTIPVFENPAHVPFIAEAVEARFSVDPPTVPAYLIRDHGITVWGRTVEEAMHRVECVAYVLEYAVAAHTAGTVWWLD